jgi:hypothetical protein
LNFSLKYITINFKLAIHSAVNEIWPLSKRVGCRFHLTQTWFRNIQQCDLATEYKKNSDIVKWTKYTFGLLHLDPEEVSDCFVEDLIPECSIDNRVVKYCDYLVKNYISEDSTFTPCLWACNSAYILLSTNACESFHLFFNDHFYSNSLSILNWLNVTRNFVQTDTYIKINSVEIPKTTKDANIIKRQVYNQKQTTKYRSN